MTVKKITKNKIELQSNQTCFINSVVTKESSFYFSIYEFENLVKYIDIKNEMKIQETYINIKDSTIENSLLHTQEFMINFSLDSIIRNCNLIGISISKNEIIKQYRLDSKMLNNPTPNNTTLINESFIDTKIHIQTMIDYICESKNPSDNYDLFNYVFEEYLGTNPNETLPSFKILLAFLMKKVDELELIEIKYFNKNPIIIFKGVKFIKKNLSQAFTRLKKKVIKLQNI